MAQRRKMGEKGFVQETIESCPKINPKYVRKEERAMNPAFMNIEDVEKNFFLKKNEKRIWVLRTDKNDDNGQFRLITGSKTSAEDTVQTGVKQTGPDDVVTEEARQFVPQDDRFGHPSIAVAEGDYKGDVYRAGWVCQRVDNNGEPYLEISLTSGRYDIDTLTTEQKISTEVNVAARMMKAYGEQPVKFLEVDIKKDYKKHFLYEYMSDKCTTTEKSKTRTYTRSDIERIDPNEFEVLNTEHKKNVKEYLSRKEKEDKIIFIFENIHKYLLSERLSAAYQLYQNNQNPAVKSKYMQFMKTVLNLEDENTVLKTMEDYPRKQRIDPDFIPNHKPFNKNGSIRAEESTTRAKRNLRKLANLALAEKTGDVNPVVPGPRLKDIKVGSKRFTDIEREQSRCLISKGKFMKETRAGIFYPVDTTDFQTHGKKEYAGYTINSSGEITLFNHYSWKDEDKVAHSSVNAGRTVYAAGEVEIKNGKLISLTASSGHYRPDFLKIQQTLKFFERRGVDLSGTIVRLHEPLPVNTNVNTVQFKDDVIVEGYKKSKYIYAYNANEFIQIDPKKLEANRAKYKTMMISQLKLYEPSRYWENKLLDGIKSYNQKNPENKIETEKQVNYLRKILLIRNPSAREQYKKEEITKALENGCENLLVKAVAIKRTNYNPFRKASGTELFKIKDKARQSTKVRL